jgi:surfeit locus 1 family protein
MPHHSNVLTLVSHLIVLCVVALLCVLGTWQVSRYIDKQERIEQINLRSEQGVIAHARLSQLILDDVRDVQIRIEPVAASGSLLWLDNQQHNGQVGFKLIAAVETKEGWLLVNLGWVAGRKDRLSLPIIPSLHELQAPLSGAVSIPGLNRFITETATADGIFPKVIQQIEFTRISEFLNVPLLPYMLTVTQPNGDFIREWKPVVMEPAKHIGYALQWYGLAIAASVIYLVARRRKGQTKASNLL